MTREQKIEEAARALVAFIEERPAATHDTPLGWRAAVLRAALSTPAEGATGTGVMWVTEPAPPEAPGVDPDYDAPAPAPAEQEVGRRQPCGCPPGMALATCAGPVAAPPPRPDEETP